MNRKTCGNCESDNTEFVQFGGEESGVTKITDVGDGILELRMCNDCGAGIENVLTMERQEVLPYDG